MTMKSTVNTLIEMASKRFETDASILRPQDDFFELLGINSYQAMELLTDIEDAFDIEVPDYELQGITTFSALAEVIERRI